MKKLFIGVLFSILSSGCYLFQSTPISDQMNYTYLALGDSYTIGEGVQEEERWPVQLVERLRDRGYKMAPPKIVAKTGWSTMDLIRGIQDEVNVQRNFDLVSILIGVNNQYQGKPLDEYRRELREIFNKAIFHSKRLNKGVIALSIPDYGVTPHSDSNAEEIRREIDLFNAVYREVAEEYEVDFYNITPISREAADNPELLADDNLHPSGLMYRLWVQEIIEDVAEKLPEKELITP